MNGFCVRNDFLWFSKKWYSSAPRYVMVIELFTSRGCNDGAHSTGWWLWGYYIVLLCAMGNSLFVEEKTIAVSSLKSSFLHKFPSGRWFSPRCRYKGGGVMTHTHISFICQLRESMRVDLWVLVFPLLALMPQQHPVSVFSDPEAPRNLQKIWKTLRSSYVWR